MPLIYTKVIPEIQYYLYEFVVSSTVNRQLTPFPPKLDSVYLNDKKSFIRLLFDESWPVNFTSYRYLYKWELDYGSIPDILLRRMMIYPQTSKYYECDSDDPTVCQINIFNLVEDDITLLDCLLEYRIDSTSNTIIDIDYSSLSTSLSKLIYIYLNFKINDDYTLFDNTDVISSDLSVLEIAYESFILDKIFIYLSSLGS